MKAAILREVDALRDSGAALAAKWRRFEELRLDLAILQMSVRPASRHSEVGIDALALRLEKDRGEFLREQVPVEVTRKWRAGTQAASLAVTFEEAKGSIRGLRARDMLESLASDCLPEADAAEYERLLALDPASRTDADVERLKRWAAASRATRSEFANAWQERPKGEFEVVSYGSGTFVITGAVPAGEDGPAAAARWWTDATFEQREEWLRAWCAEKTGIVDVLKVWDLPCPMCRPDDDAAVDPEPSPGAPGCRGCGGGGIVRKVRYR